MNGWTRLWPVVNRGLLSPLLLCPKLYQDRALPDRHLVPFVFVVRLARPTEFELDLVFGPGADHSRNAIGGSIFAVVLKYSYVDRGSTVPDLTCGN